MRLEPFTQAAADFAIGLGGGVTSDGNTLTVHFTHAGAAVVIVIASRDEDNAVTVTVKPPKSARA